MSTPLTTVRARCQVRLREMDQRRNSLSPIEYDQAIADAFIEITTYLPATHLYASSDLTLSDATSGTFTMATTSARQYAGDIRIRLRSTGFFLRRRTVEELDAIRSGVSPFQAVPTDYALWEEPDQEVQGRCWPYPRTAEACDVYRAVVPSDLRAFDLDTVTVDLSRPAELALECLVAANLADSLTDDDMKLRRLNPKVVASWRATAARILYKEAARRHDIEAVGRIQRWVS